MFECDTFTQVKFLNAYLYYSFCASCGTAKI